MAEFKFICLSRQIHWLKSQDNCKKGTNRHSVSIHTANRIQRYNRKLLYNKIQKDIRIEN